MSSFFSFGNISFSSSFTWCFTYSISTVKCALRFSSSGAHAFDRLHEIAHVVVLDFRFVQQVFDFFLIAGLLANRRVENLGLELVVDLQLGAGGGDDRLDRLLNRLPRAPRIP